MLPTWRIKKRSRRGFDLCHAPDNTRPMQIQMSQGFVRGVGSALAAARATRRRAKLLAAGGLAATGMKEPSEAQEL